jgi:hypothetical protein
MYTSIDGTWPPSKYGQLSKYVEITANLRGDRRNPVLFDWKVEIPHKKQTRPNEFIVL